MYRIRFHGRGGQGMKTASRILGRAFFAQGFEVQDAPRYGAERRGAPIFAYVRADRDVIDERGIIVRPDLVVVADDTLLAIPAAGTLAGIDEHTALLIVSREPAATWRSRLNLSCAVVVISEGAEDTVSEEMPFKGAVCAGGAARLLGVIERDTLRLAIEQELGAMPPAMIRENRDRGLHAFDGLAGHAGTVREGSGVPAADYRPPQWVDLPLQPAGVAAPVIHAPATSVEVRTGLWRSMRPVIDDERCVGCWWVCSTFCPDGAIEVREGRPVIDYDHCKGCMVCVAKCPPHAIETVSEHAAGQAGQEARTRDA
jgi:pyruvate ferredoxin oxidoreductase gamma subunit